ncbi:MAG: polyphosphate kinase 1 [Bacteroidales bacterium]|nr:polyphosphate kinase 1 [Bacteroidales bacterium]MBN2762133.1 polyphosphate kinase 1 [Bacteroidales bacterium]
MKEQARFIHREISWLSFNERVLQEAQDLNVPLIERIRFLGIFSNNLDEFFKVRVATIKRMIDFRGGDKLFEGEKAKKLMNKIQKKVIQLQNKFEYTYQQIVGELEKNGIFIINEMELNPTQGSFVKKYFYDNVMPFISPVLLSNVNEFPYLKDKSIYLAIKLSGNQPQVQTDYALIEVPTGILPRFIVLPSENERKFIILLEDVIRYSLDDVFALFHFDISGAWIIKLTRDAELDMDNDISKSLLELISTGVDSRKEGQPVRFVFDNSIAKDLLDSIIIKLRMDVDSTLIPGGRYHNFKDFMQFPNVDGPEMLYSKDIPLKHPQVRMQSSILDAMAKKDFMLHVPYHDFIIFVRLLQEASIDPRVTEISLTVYRVASNSMVLNALISAARNGKRVNVVIELQARFDEEANIYWSRKLEEVGANVFFGIPDLKVHAKLLCITRKENNKTVNYSCVSTGNFHEGNAAVYSDLILFTADSRITNEVAKVFDFFENTYRNYTFRHLINSPLFLRKKIYALIENEIKNARKGKEAYIILKINNLVDKEIIYKLYRANRAGVKIKLIVRGICSLIPGVPGLSENIEAISIVDKYLEHSRVVIFCNGGHELFYISSADWMNRNLDRRIEVSCPIYDKDVQQEIRDLIEIQLHDNMKARIINPVQDNSYVKVQGTKKLRAQVELYKYYSGKLKN